MNEQEANEFSKAIEEMVVKYNSDLYEVIDIVKGMIRTNGHRDCDTCKWDNLANEFCIKCDDKFSNWEERYGK